MGKEKFKLILFVCPESVREGLNSTNLVNLQGILIDNKLLS